MKANFTKMAAALAFVALTNPQSACAASQTDTGGPHIHFQWPEPDPNALPDARVDAVVAKAREEAAKAKRLAKQADALAGKLTRELDWPALKQQRVSDGVVMTGRQTRAGAGETAYVGKMRYDDGAEMTGLFRFIHFPDNSSWGVGVATGSPMSSMSNFTGEFAAPADIRSRPSQGVAAFKNGDRFSGMFYIYSSDGDAVGIYEDAAGSRRFIGEVKPVDRTFQPKEGVVEDSKGRLLAVIR